MRTQINESKRQFYTDYVLVILILLSAIVGLVGIYLAAPFNNLDTSKSDIIRQISWFFISFAFLTILLKLGTDRLFTVSYVAYGILLVLLVIQVMARYRIINTSLIPEINGAYAWYIIPKVGSFQPSEFMKVMLIFITANIISKHNKEKEDKSFTSDFILGLKIAKFAIPPLILIVLQPDSGIPIIIVISLVFMFFLSGVRSEWFIIIFSFAFVAFFGIIFLYYNNPALLNRLFGGNAQSYRLNRFYGWLDYEKYSGSHGHHLYNAIASIGTAGWTGHPIGSVILQIPEAQTDFIFAVLAQNFGFAGGVSVIILAFALDLRLIWIALKSDLDRERYLLAGAIAMLFFQHTENIGMVLGVLPITGITLPFFSYGGSSILSYMFPFSVAFYMYSEIKHAHKH
ncbi:MAG: FtsW/RodA/SpoVE family cell cycle protein [Erysipelothrix sp.]|nr:FtsW/RodA/SpoVE family cell cycle protein [Erysipelothrix sp.]